MWRASASAPAPRSIGASRQAVVFEKTTDKELKAIDANARPEPSEAAQELQKISSSDDKDKPAELEKRIYEALRANFQEEAAIQREAERILDENKRQTTGMDQRTLLSKIKQKLAHERGFVL